MFLKNDWLSIYICRFTAANILKKNMLYLYSIPDLYYMYIYIINTYITIYIVVYLYIIYICRIYFVRIQLLRMDAGMHLEIYSLSRDYVSQAIRTRDSSNEKRRIYE